MWFRRIFLAASLVFVCVAAPAQNVNLKVDVNLVMVDAVVRDSRGAVAGELRPEDFAVYDNGVVQRLTHFSCDQLPLAVALVIDRSPSIAPYLKQLRSAAISALNRLRPEDEVVLFSFDICPTRLSDLTGDRSQIARRIGEIRTGTSTNIYGAVFNAAQYLRQAAPDRRRAIILISDNSPNVFHLGESDVIREALESGVILYSIRTPGENPPSGQTLSRPMFTGEGSADATSVERIAGETGGEVLNLSKAGEFSQALDSAISSLRLGYTLGFTPSDLGESGSYHRLSVKVAAGQRCPDCQVQTRAGYYVASNSKLPRESGYAETYDCEQSVAAEFLRSPYAMVPEYPEVPFKVAVSQTSEGGRQQVKLDLQIDGRKVTLQTGGGRYAGRLLVAAFYTDQEGNRLGEDWKGMEIGSTEQDIRQLRQSGISCSLVVPIVVPKQTIRIFVYDLKSRFYGLRIVKMK